VSLFFERAVRGLSEKQLLDWEAELPVRVYLFCDGVSKRAAATLPQNLLKWLGFTDSEPSDQFDPTDPHWVVMEIQRRFLTIKPYRPDWIYLNEEQLEALEILHALRSVARAVAGLDPTAALTLLSAGNWLGHITTAAHVTPWEEPAASHLRWRERLRKPRRQEINDWILDTSTSQPQLTRDQLWEIAPDWITDQIGIHSFRKRTSEVRKRIKNSS
jgi:hypothetical protein